MVETPSTMLDLGTEAPAFSLPDLDGKTVSLSDFPGAKAYLVMFICNHCPYVKHVQSVLAPLAARFQAQGAAVMAINSNDTENYPADSPEKMVDEARLAGYTFPYLYDESQQVAQAYRAACTPDFFVFDKDKNLVYRGRMDASRPGSDIPVTGADLTEAMEAAMAGRTPPGDQLPSVGCNIKWKPGNEPDYFG
ncbi:MAG: thioredoxin family protein [Nitrospinota bacterium]|nr:thioredoxin family protein [Nitrospinota bacterium]